MTTNVIQFPAFNGQQLRHVMIEGEPWFVSADVCRSLGLDMSKGSYRHVIKLNEDERRGATRADHPELFSGRTASLHTLVSEPGLYKLIQRSNKPEAKLFDRWVRHDVLPSIRKTGGYLLNEHARETAHADTRDAMPFPKEFMAFFEKQMEQEADNVSDGRDRRCNALCQRSDRPSETAGNCASPSIGN